MKLSISLKIDRIKELNDKLKNVALIETPVEIDLSNKILKEINENFIPLLAVEIEDLGLNVKYIRINKFLKGYELERLLNLVDYLNTQNLIIKPPLDIDSLIETIDTAVMYGIKVILLTGCENTILQNLDNVNEIANQISPYVLRLAIDITKQKSLKNFIKTYLQTSSYVKVLYYSNKSNLEKGLPIFDEHGKIDYLKITKILSMLKYENDIILRYQPKYYSHYFNDVNTLSTFITSISSSIIDRRLKNVIDRIVNEIVNT